MLWGKGRMHRAGDQVIVACRPFSCCRAKVLFSEIFTGNSQKETKKKKMLWQKQLAADRDRRRKHWRSHPPNVSASSTAWSSGKRAVSQELASGDASPKHAKERGKHHLSIHQNLEHILRSAEDCSMFRRYNRIWEAFAASVFSFQHDYYVGVLLLLLCGPSWDNGFPAWPSDVRNAAGPMAAENPCDATSSFPSSARQGRQINICYGCWSTFLGGILLGEFWFKFFQPVKG